MPIPTEPRNIDFPEKMQFLFEPAKYKVGWGGRMGLKSWSFAERCSGSASSGPSGFSAPVNCRSRLTSRFIAFWPIRSALWA